MNHSPGQITYTTLGCISLGGAYTYYQKKRADRIDEAIKNDQPQTEKKPSSDPKKTDTPTNKPDDSKKTAPEKNIDYQQVYNDIAELLDSNEE